MTHFNALSQYTQDRGFILVTSLIFLVVITLISVSAINSSTLQERMASNLREKARARQAADAALREAETRLAGDAFVQLNAASGCSADIQSARGGGAPLSSFPICYAGSFLGGNKSAAFLDSETWNHPATQRYSVDQTLADDVKYVVEEIRDCPGPSLDPDQCALGATGVRYRITAYAQGQNPAAVAVTQSVYAKPY